MKRLTLAVTLCRKLSATVHGFLEQPCTVAESLRSAWVAIRMSRIHDAKNKPQSSAQTMTSNSLFSIRLR